MPFDPHRHRVQLFTGKGGVGKSSVVAAHALACARAGLRPLVVELGHRATMESIFDVRVVRVNTITRKGKEKRQGWTKGRRKDTKRALVTLADGNSIDLFGV